MIRVTCPICFVEHGIPEEMNATRRRDHGRVFCPMGHGWSYMAESEEEKLRRERDRLKQQMAQKEDEAREALAAETDARKKIERKLRRVQKGVCPHCTRSFQNLQQHMATKHACEAAGMGRKLAVVK